MGFCFRASLLVLFVWFSVAAEGWRPWPEYFQQGSNGSAKAEALFGVSKKNEGSSPFVKMRYHMGPVLTSAINVHTIWYGSWDNKDKRIIKEFLLSISSSTKSPSVGEWWKTVQLYTDQTGANVSRNIVIAGEHRDHYSHGKILSRMTVQEVVKNVLTAKTDPLPIDPKNGLYLLLTSSDVAVQDFCRAVCGFHYFIFPSIVGYTLPYAWVGHSGKQCPDLCAYPFAVPFYMTGMKPFQAPNGDVGIDGMVSVIAHELAEISSNPLINAWYAGEDPTSPTEIADLCEGVYGTGGGGSYTGQTLTDKFGANYNVHGIRSIRAIINTPGHIQGKINRILKMSIKKFPTTYLGLPLFVGKMSKDIWNPLIDRLQRKLAGWKWALLSQAGKLQLVASTLQSIPVF